jgi:hypothetical protein
MWIISKLLDKKKELGISTEQIKAKIYDCLSEGKTPEQVIVDNRLADWELLKHNKEAILYIKYIHGRMK